MNYYEHHIGDYDADTAHLTWLEDMAYTRLMRLYYRKESPIPTDVGQACRLVRATAKDERAAVETVLREFFTLREDGWHQERCNAEVAKYQERVEHNRRVGKKGGRPRKSIATAEPGGNPEPQKEKPEQNPPGYFREPGQNPPQSPVPSPHTPDSVPDGTDGGAPSGRKSPADLTKDELWKAGKSLLAQAGLPVAQCGSFVGKLVKDYGDQVVVEAVRAAVAARPADPMEYLKAICQRAAGQRPAVNKQEALEQRNRNVADEWAAQGASHAAV